VKPREAHKAFTGYVLSAFRDLIPTTHHPNDLTVWSSEVVEFVSEWRYFVWRHEFVGLGHYRGDAFTHPDGATIRAAVATYRDKAPVAYGIDFGVTPEGRTLLVEVNDAYSLGHVGLRAVPYANMLESRWVEMVTTRSPVV
jgi:ATP-grasp domain, R2K clade family 2